MTDKILWADDEIDLLKPHILFLKAKGYEVTTVSNGRDALDALENEPYSLILLDENMPGISGLETLALINRSHPDIPVIMITKSEEENIMDQAIGNQIADYLIKPVNPCVEVGRMVVYSSSDTLKNSDTSGNTTFHWSSLKLSKKEPPQPGDSGDTRFFRISAGFHENLLADKHSRFNTGLDGCIPRAGKMGTQTCRDRQFNVGDASDAETRCKLQFLQIRETQLRGLGDRFGTSAYEP